MPKGRRRTVRLKGYDYSQPGAYFVTVCTAARQPIFGRIIKGRMAVTAAGEIVQVGWDALPRHFADVTVDAFVIMPNHFHGILMILSRDGVGAKASCRSGCFAPTVFGRPRGTAAGSLAAIVQNLKSVTTRRMNALRSIPRVIVWQRGYYEHVIRNDFELAQTREHIVDNPLRWEEDKYYSVVCAA
jgi:putative transposase